MSKITPNRTALKELADLNIDAPFVQRYGNRIFSYDGDATDEFKSLCENLSTTADEAIAELQAIKKAIPVINSK
tara:strand:- start:5094 stop:5315 length:222 start_codon:yes stop_codon:yes gene_type:complete